MKKIEIDIQKLTEFHSQGLSDNSIALKFQCNAETIRNRRKALGLVSNQGVTINGVHIKQTSIKLKQLQPLVEQGLSDYKIGPILGYDARTIYQARKFYKLQRESLKHGKHVNVSPKQLEILIGHLLGDGSFRRNSVNATGKISQGIAQLEYTKWKVQELKPLCSDVVIYTRKTIDVRTGLYYTSAEASIYANPELNWVYDMFYGKGYKELNSSLLMYVTPISLAVWFMDDGYIGKEGSYCIATNSFKERDVLKSIFKKFGIEITIHKIGVTYIPRKYGQKFANLISPFIIPSMWYKLHRSHVTPLIQGKP
jgi:hypothetical protein